MSTRSHIFHRHFLTFSFIHLFFSSAFIYASRNDFVLHDTSSEVTDVQPIEEEEDWIKIDDPENPPTPCTDDLEEPAASCTDDLEEYSTLYTSDLISEHLKGLLERGRFDEIAEFGDIVGNDEILDRTSDVTLHFLVHSDATLVHETIIKAGTVEGPEQHISDDLIKIALVISFDQDQHDRILLLMNAIYTRYSMTTVPTSDAEMSLEIVLYDFLKKLAPENDNAPLRRFLTFYIEEFRTGYPVIFETFCRTLVKHLKNTLPNPTSNKLLTDLIGQPQLLTLAAFIKPFLVSSCVRDTDLTEFVEYAWREPMSKVLRDERWKTQILRKTVLLHEFPHGPPKEPIMSLYEYHNWEGVIATTLKRFKTKQEVEDEWNKKNAPIVYKKIENLIPLPEVLLIIISEYAVSLTDV